MGRARGDAAALRANPPSVSGDSALTCEGARVAPLRRCVLGAEARTVPSPTLVEFGHRMWILSSSTDTPLRGGAGPAGRSRRTRSTEARAGASRLRRLGGPAPAGAPHPGRPRLPLAVGLPSRDDTHTRAGWERSGRLTMHPAFEEAPRPREAMPSACPVCVLQLSWPAVLIVCVWCQGEEGELRLGCAIRAVKEPGAQSICFRGEWP